MSEMPQDDAGTIEAAGKAPPRWSLPATILAYAILAMLAAGSIWWIDRKVPTIPPPTSMQE